jgi:predicted amidohydrolase YtcJ
MTFTEHHDAPVVPPNALRVVWAAANRTSRSGDVIGAEQRIDAYDALRSVTVWAAYQLFEEDGKGTLDPGKLADFVILDRNPLRVPVAEIADLRVLETVKEGRSIYTAR